jgi:hypothetical protein
VIGQKIEVVPNAKPTKASAGSKGIRANNNLNFMFYFLSVCIYYIAEQGPISRQFILF